MLFSVDAKTPQPLRGASLRIKLSGRLSSRVAPLWEASLATSGKDLKPVLMGPGGKCVAIVLDDAADKCIRGGRQTLAH